MFSLVKIQLVLTVFVFGAYIVPILGNVNDEEVHLSIDRDGRFFPGSIIDTYWCGSGNLSRGRYELGSNAMVDACCYIHYHCPFYLEPGEVKFGKKNTGMYTQVSCDCDDTFDRCIRNVGNWSAALVTAAYARIRPKCIQLETICTYPRGNYELTPCPALFCPTKSKCEVSLKWVDSKFKIHRFEKDLEEPRKTKEERNRMMFHRSTTPIPSAMHIINP